MSSVMGKVEKPRSRKNFFFLWGMTYNGNILHTWFILLAYHTSILYFNSVAWLDYTRKQRKLYYFYLTIILWGRVLLWKVIVAQLTIFTVFYGLLCFITVLTRTHLWSIFWDKSVQTLCPISLKSILTLLSHLCLGLPSVPSSSAEFSDLKK